MMLPMLDSALLTTNGLLVGLMGTWWLQKVNLSELAITGQDVLQVTSNMSSPLQSVTKVSREVLELLRQAAPYQSATNPTFDCCDSLQQRPGLGAYGLGKAGWEAPKVELFMVACECIVFVGTEEECSDFLSERGMVPLEGSIEPLDRRLQDNLDRLGLGLIDYLQDN